MVLFKTNAVHRSVYNSPIFYKIPLLPIKKRQIFVRLLLMSSAMSLVLLHRVISVGPWREILSRFAEFAVVQVFPLLWLLLWRLAQFKVGSKWMSQLPG